jgi:hypothetical protein
MTRHLLALALTFSILLAAAPRPAPSTPSALYLSGPILTADANTLTRLDPTTLADLPHPPLRLPAKSGYTAWHLSADGATLLAVVYPPNGTTAPAEAILLDPATGLERRRFALPLPHGNVRVSRDGSRLVMTPPIRRGPGYVAASSTWYVVDAADGRLLSRAELPGDGLASWIDPTASRVFHVVEPPNQTGPEPLLLHAHDLATGTSLGVLGPLLDVPYGSWPIDRSGQSDAYAFAHSMAGIALSPDGRHLAVVPAERDELLLVDTADMGVVARTPFRAASPLHDWLPFWPRPAFAKESEGVLRQATFAPDGRALYVRESVYTADEELPRVRLLRVDVAAGLTAERSFSEPLFDFAVSPDGRRLYVTQPAPRPSTQAACASPTCPYVLRRLDATTLATLAERPLRGHRSLATAPSP